MRVVRADDAQTNPEKRGAFSLLGSVGSNAVSDLLLENVDRALSADFAAAVDVGVGGDSGS